MKNITLSAQDDIIDGLRQVARKQNTTLNDMFRDWASKQLAAANHAEQEKRLKALEKSFKTLSFTTERTYTREEMNER